MAKELYLIDLTIKSTNPGSPNPAADLYKAVRVHFSDGTTNALFASDSDKDTTTIETATSGKLDLNNDGAYDTEPAYEWDEEPDPVIYGGSSAAQTAYNAAKSGVLANDDDPYSITANNGKIADIPANADGITVTVTIWIEGWQKLAGIPSGNKETGSSAIWDDVKYVEKNFQVGMRFAVEAHNQATDHPAP